MDYKLRAGKPRKEKICIGCGKGHHSISDRCFYCEWKRLGYIKNKTKKRLGGPKLIKARKYQGGVGNRQPSI